MHIFAVSFNHPKIDRKEVKDCKDESGLHFSFGCPEIKAAILVKL